MSSFSPADVSGATELTLVRADVTRAQIQALCEAALERGCYGVCVNSSRVIDAYHFGAEAGLKIISTIGFPFGSVDADAKRYEAETAIDAGAHEIDAVMNIGLLKDAAHDALLRELSDIVEAAEGRPVKVLIDLSLLDPKETVVACRLAIESGAKFVSVSAPVEVVEKMSGTLNPAIGLKAFASKMAEAHRLLEAGAKRIGQVGS